MASNVENISAKLTEGDRVQRMRRAFERADSDSSGKIPRAQFTNAAQAAGLDPSEKDVDSVLQHFDKDEDSGIDFEEFIEMVSHLEVGKEQEYEECLRKAFRQIDRDGSGFISPEELCYVVCNTGEKFSQSEAEELISMFDVNKDGELSWEEFVTFIKSSIEGEEEDEKLVTTEQENELNADIDCNKL